MLFKLKTDHYSKGKDHKLYGIKGDKVKLISETETVCIVENNLGQRFPIETDLIEKI